MRAAVFKGVGTPLSVENVSDPVLEADQLLIQVSHCGICGSDLHLTEAEGRLPHGAILGHEFAGIVVESNGTGHANGSRVTALPLFPCWTCEECRAGHLFHCATPAVIGVDARGAYAEAIAVDGRLVQSLPAGVGFEEGALVEPLAVGRRMVRLAEGLKGARVLILGGGPVGAAGAIFARLHGAARVVVSEPGAARRAKVLELGAHAAIDPAVEDVSARAGELCGGAPDIVFECVGRPGLFAQAIKAVRARGQIVSAGASFQYDGFVPIDALVKELTIRFSAGYAIEDFAATIDALARGDIAANRLVTGRVALDRLPDVFETLRQPGGHCKVIVDIAA